MVLPEDGPEVVLVVLGFVQKGEHTVIHDEPRQEASDALCQPSSKRKKTDLNESGKSTFALNKPSSRNGSTADLSLILMLPRF